MIWVVSFILLLIFSFGLIGYKIYQRDIEESYILHQISQRIDYVKCFLMWMKIQTFCLLFLLSKHDLDTISCAIGIPLILMSMIFLNAFFGIDRSKIELNPEDKKKFIRDKKLNEILNN